jgi:hypothetical protein
MKKFLFIFAILFFFSHSADASEIEFIAPKEAFVGQVLTLDVKIGQLKEPVNAVSGTLVYDPKTIKISKILDGGSVVSLWLKPIEIVSEGKIEFAGITPGGLISGKLFSLELLSSTEGLQNIKLQDLKLVLNDGSGNSYMAIDQVAGVNFIATTTEAIIETPQFKDTVLPLPFEIQLGRDKTLFNNQWFAVFNAYDQDSGILYYEVAESKTNSQEGLKWNKATSPYVLKDQLKTGFLFVKAVDREGNSRLVVLKLLEKKQILNNYAIYVIIVLVIGVILALARRFKKQNV